jgi:hypothetical protein
MATPEGSPPADDDGRVVRFRPRSGAPGGWRWPRRNLQQSDTPVGDLAKFEQGEPEDDFRHRMKVNVLAFVVIIVLVIVGLWLAGKIADMVQTQDCFLSGRRNCAPIDVRPVERG